MKIFISQPMKDYSDFEIESIRGQITVALKEKYGNDIEIIDSFIKGAPANAKPLWYLGESIKKLSEADIAVFAYNAPDNSLVRGCGIEEKCARKYDILCLYIGFNKSTYKSAVDINVGNLTTERPDFAE